LPILIICADCGKVVSVKPTRDRDIRSIMWGYCDKCAERLAIDAKRKHAQKMLLEAPPRA